MPELPEVETVVRDLVAEGLPGCTVTGARVRWPRSITGMSPRAFTRRIKGQTVAGVRRRAKYIVIDLASGEHVLVHLRMTGRLAMVGAAAPRNPHEHVVLSLDNGRDLRFIDPRKFGRWWLVCDAEAQLGHLGPEPLASGFTARKFQQRLQRRRGMLKPLLLNQQFIAGLGNIYVDEALWDAGLHPRTRCETLSDAEQRALYRSIRKVLRRGIRCLGTSLGASSTNFYSVAGRRGRNQDGLKVFRRTGQPCPDCGTPIERLLVGQRSTHICPACQVER